MSPEVTQGVKYTSKADIFALGCAMYELLTFELPFSDDNIAQLFNKILTEQPEPIKGDYDDECKDIIYSMLEKDPDMRPSIYELYQNEFIKDRVNEWCLQDHTIKTYVESIVSLNKNKTKKLSTHYSTASVLENEKDNPNYYIEHPN